MKSLPDRADHDRANPNSQARTRPTPTPNPMPITSDQALSVLTTRGLTLQATSDGQWITRQRTGARVRVPPADSPLSAIEAADAHLSAADSSAQERTARAILSEQQRGTHFARPRIVRETDPSTGETADVTVFDIRRTSDGGLTTVVGRRSVAAAWAEWIKNAGQ